MKTTLKLVAITAYFPSLAMGAEHMVHQKDKTFAPAVVEAKLGDTITFVNDDSVAHNVFAKSEVSNFNLKVQKPGEKSSIKLEKEGEFDARCAIHPKMTIKVKISK